MGQSLQGGDVINMDGDVYGIGFEKPRRDLLPLIPSIIPARRGWCQTGPRVWVNQARVALATPYETARAKAPKRRPQYRPGQH
jgi:hypothetical protein